MTVLHQCKTSLGGLWGLFRRLQYHIYPAYQIPSRHWEQQLMTKVYI